MSHRTNLHFSLKLFIENDIINKIRCDDRVMSETTVASTFPYECARHIWNSANFHLIFDMGDIGQTFSFYYFYVVSYRNDRLLRMLQIQSDKHFQSLLESICLLLLFLLIVWVPALAVVSFQVGPKGTHWTLNDVHMQSRTRYIYYMYSIPIPITVLKTNEMNAKKSKWDEDQATTKCEARWSAITVHLWSRHGTHTYNTSVCEHKMGNRQIGKNIS